MYKENAYGKQCVVSRRRFSTYQDEYFILEVVDTLDFKFLAHDLAQKPLNPFIYKGFYEFLFRFESLIVHQKNIIRTTFVGFLPVNGSDYFFLLTILNSTYAKGGTTIFIL